MADIVLEEGTNVLNVGLTPIPPVASLYGVVTDAETGFALSGSRLRLMGWSPTPMSTGHMPLRG